MRTTRFLLYLAIVIIPLGTLLNRPIFESAGKDVPLSPIEIVIGLLVVSYCMWKLRRSQWPTTEVPGYGAVLLFPAWCIVSLVISKARLGLSVGATAFSGLYLVRWIAFACLYFVTYEIAVSRSTVKRIAKWILVGGIAVAGFGLFQAAFLPADVALMMHPEARAYTDFDPQGHRLVSTFLDPNIAAAFIAIPAIIALSFYLHGDKRWTVPLLLLVAAIAATLSRGGALGFLAGAVCLFWSSRRFRARMIKAGLAILLVLLALYPFVRGEAEYLNKFTLDDPSALGRVAYWLLTLDVIKDHWLTGIGFNTFGYIWPQYYGPREGASAFGVENDFLMILLLTGIVGLIIYLRMCRTMLASLSELGRTSPVLWDRAFARGVWAATFAVFVNSFFTTGVLYAPIVGILWILWALGRRLHDWNIRPPSAVGAVVA